MICRRLTSSPYVMAGVIIGLFTVAFGCGGPSFSLFKKGTQTTLKGEIDTIERTEVTYDEKPLSVTMIGLASGEGVTLVGLQPGLGKGKIVKIEAVFFENIQGTDVFKVRKITPMKTAPAPQDKMDKKEMIPASPAPPAPEKETPMPMKEEPPVEEAAPTPPAQ